MSNQIVHKANTRGHANHDWLIANHTFSFSSYYNPERMNFGALRVLNDDSIGAAKGFGEHPHDNMEIISIPLEGALEHKDSLGNTAVIQKGDIQVMSAGTGVFHSEYNKNSDQSVQLLQIWVYPNQKNVTPRYEQVTLDKLERKNKFQQILSPNADDEGVWIHQDAWFHLGIFDKNRTTHYTIKKQGNGVYVFVISGSVKIENQILEPRDGFGIWNTNDFTIEITDDNTEILLMEVPMTF